MPGRHPHVLDYLPPFILTFENALAGVGIIRSHFLISQTNFIFI
jgi:hypothetical protein